jgi:hypothetical protein
MRGIEGFYKRECKNRVRDRERVDGRVGEEDKVGGKGRERIQRRYKDK